MLWGQRNRERSLLSSSTVCVLGNTPRSPACGKCLCHPIPSSFSLSPAAVYIMKFAFNTLISSDSTAWQMCLGISLLGKMSSDKGSPTGIRLQIFPQRLPTVVFCYPRGLMHIDMYLHTYEIDFSPVLGIRHMILYRTSSLNNLPPSLSPV